MKSLQFNGNGLEYFKIWIVNILLTIITLGLYYPWAKVRNNRYFYGNSTLEERNFDYHATGKQLFISYIVAVVLFLIYIGIQQISVIGSAIVIAIFFIAFPWIIWRSLMFNMRVTSFSNVRFSFDGKVGGAYFNYMLLPILFFVSLYGAPIFLGIMLPQMDSMISEALIILIAIAIAILAIYLFALMKKRNVSYFINSAHYGQGNFSTNLKAAPFIFIMLKSLGLLILGLFAYFILIGLVTFLTGDAASLLELAGNLDDPYSLQNAAMGGAFALIIIALYIGFIAIGILVFSYSMSRQRQYIYQNTQLDNKISFKSTMGARATASISLTNLLAVIFSLGLAIPWAKVRMARFMLENTHVDTSVGFDEYVTQQQKEQSALGDQIGDAFDVDVGIGF